jgi:hypothetical protein
MAYYSNTALRLTKKPSRSLPLLGTRWTLKPPSYGIIIKLINVSLMEGFR